MGMDFYLLADIETSHIPIYFACSVRFVGTPPSPRFPELLSRRTAQSLEESPHMSQGIDPALIIQLGRSH